MDKKVSMCFDENYFKSKNILGDRKFAFAFYSFLVSKYLKGGKVLELGCSFGNLLKRLEKGYDTYGVDISPHAIAIAKKNCKSSILLNSDISSIDKNFKRNFFDLVIALHVFEHLKNPKIILSKINHLLRRDGILIFTVPNMNSPMRKLLFRKWFGDRDETHLSMYYPDKWRSLLKSGNFLIVKEFSDGFWDSPYLPLIPNIIQKPAFGILTFIQFVFKIPFIPVNLGENIIFIARKVES